jgi:hypothetical protein
MNELVDIVNKVNKSTVEVSDYHPDHEVRFVGFLTPGKKDPKRDSSKSPAPSPASTAHVTSQPQAKKQKLSHPEDKAPVLFYIIKITNTSRLKHVAINTGIECCQERTDNKRSECAATYES